VGGPVLYVADAAEADARADGLEPHAYRYTANRQARADDTVGSWRSRFANDAVLVQAPYIPEGSALGCIRPIHVITARLTAMAVVPT
jgi:hypothetical protein